VRQAVVGANLSLLLGNQIHQGETHHLRMDNLFIHVNDIKNLILRSDGDRIIRLQDIADVIDAPPTERTQMVNASMINPLKSDLLGDQYPAGRCKLR